MQGRGRGQTVGQLQQDLKHLQLDVCLAGGGLDVQHAEDVLHLAEGNHLVVEKHLESLQSHGHLQHRDNRNYFTHESTQS